MADLLASAKAGDRAALNELLERFRPWLKRLAQKHPPHSGDASASDVVQEVLLQVIKNFDQFRGQTAGEFAAWLRTIVFHKSMDFLKRKPSPAPLPEGSSEQIQISGDHKEFCADQENANEMIAAIAQLPRDYRTVIELRYFQEMKHEEIATALALSNDATRQLCSRALKRLRQLLLPPD